MITIYGAGVVGEAVLYACIERNIVVDYFCDDSIKKIGQEINGIKIISTHEAIALENNNFIISIADIGDAILKISQGKYSFAHLYLESFNPYLYTFSKKTDFVQYAIDTCISCHKAFENPNKLFLRSVDLVITERCSLKCKDCSNLMQYYAKPQHIDTSKLLISIDKLCELADEINEIRLIGGEPLIHPEHYLITEKIIQKSNIKKIVIYTNGTVNISSDKIDRYKNSKIVFIITDYGILSRNIGRLISTLENNNITYIRQKAGGWTDCAKIVSNNDGLKLFNSCCTKNTFTLLHNRFFRCPFSAHAISLGLIYDYKADYIDILEGKKSDLIKFIHRPELYSCYHCQGRSYDAPEIEAGMQICQK